MQRTVQEVLENYEYVEVKQEEDAKIEYEEFEKEMQIDIKPEIMLPKIKRTVEEVVEDFEFVAIKKEEDEIYDDPANENEEDVGQNQDATYCSNSQTEEESSKDENGFPPAKTRNKHLSKIKPKHPDIRSRRLSSCPVCNKMISYTYMKKHMRTHTGEKPYSCDICEASFSLRGNLIKHKLARHSEPNDRIYKCQTCEKSFKRLDLLKGHQRREKKGKLPNQSLSKDFQCMLCDKSFTTKQYLRQHSITHGEKKFLCNVCERGFVSKDLLNSHSKVHMAVRPHACHVCGKAFSQLGHLKTHKLIHTGEKPHACSVCSKAFTHTTNLKVHIRIHTGEKPYSCELCGKSFTFSGALSKHKRVHTREKPKKQT